MSSMDFGEVRLHKLFALNANRDPSGLQEGVSGRVGVQRQKSNGIHSRLPICQRHELAP